MRRRTFLWTTLAGGLGPAVAMEPPDRLALLIGNAGYKRQPLRNPVNDARAVSASLRALGFQTEVVEDASLREMITALQRFSIAARKYTVRLLFYAGHGLQIRGRNYLVPVDAEIGSEDQVARMSVDVADLLERLGELRDGVNILILDACRNNPFVNQPAVDADGRRFRTREPKPLGLAGVDAPRGCFVAYATAPGTVAIDSGAQANSVYTRHLLEHIGSTGLPIELMFKRVRSGVARETQQLQIPWESSSLTGEFCFSLAEQQKCGV